jgi:hypothetical protein
MIVTDLMVYHVAVPTDDDDDKNIVGRDRTK